MPLLGFDPWTFWTKAMCGVSALTLSLVSPLDLNCVYLEVPCEVRDGSLNSLARCNMGYLPKLFLTVLETSTEMLSGTLCGKQMAQLCLSYTIWSLVTYEALNMYVDLRCFELKLWSFPCCNVLGRVIPVLSLIMEACLNAGGIYCKSL